MGRVYLREEDHVYIDPLDLDFKFTSVTRVLSHYEQPFDADYHSKRIANRDGITQEEVLAKWKLINKIAIDYGKKVHSIMERHLLNRQNMYIPRDDFELLVLEEFAKLKLLLNHRIVKPEYVLTHPLRLKYGLAGCGDVIEDVDEVKFNLWDFKTNKELTFETRYDDWLKFPLNHLSQTKYNVDCLQLSTYAYFYELETGKKVNTLGIIYWDRGNELEATVGVWKVLYVPYLKTDIKAMIDHFAMTTIK